MHLTTYFEDVKINYTVSKLQHIEIYYSHWGKTGKTIGLFLYGT